MGRPTRAPLDLSSLSEPELRLLLRLQYGYQLREPPPRWPLLSLGLASFTVIVRS